VAAPAASAELYDPRLDVRSRAASLEREAGRDEVSFDVRPARDVITPLARRRGVRPVPGALELPSARVVEAHDVAREARPATAEESDSDAGCAGSGE